MAKAAARRTPDRAANQARSGETALRLLQLIERTAYEEAEAILARSPLASQISDPVEARKLAATFGLKPEQFAILRALVRYGAERENLAVRLHALGEMEFLASRPGKAITAIGRSLAIEPANINALLILARSEAALGLHDSAAKNLERAAGLAPENSDLRTEIGQIYTQMGLVEQAVRSFSLAVSLNRRNFNALFNLANALKSLGRSQEAITAYSQALEINPGHVEALNNRGATLQVLNRDEEALRDFEAATRIDGRHLFAWLNRSVSLTKVKKTEESLAALDVAFSINASMPETFQNYGLALVQLDRHEEALGYFDAANMLAPEKLQGLLSKGNALHSLGRYSQAIDTFREAIEKDASYTDAYINSAGSLQELARHGEAIAIMDQALAVRPGYPEAFWNKANSMLPFGPSEEAWKAYEHRLHISVGEPLPDFGLPLLGDDAPDGKKILVQWEQRFGDVIQMLRYVPDMVEACECHWQVADSMLDLVRASFPEISICGRSDRPPGLDARTPYTSLPLNLRTFSVGAIPARTPYLKASDACVEKWRGRASSQNRRVGIAWRGNPLPPGRTVPLEKAMPLLEAFGAHLVSLQMDPTTDEARMLERFGVLDLGSEIGTFDDSAALLSELDLVITIDTAVAHLAGALGRRTWVLLKYGADWRWMLERSDSPWYPTATLYRQSTVGEWKDVIGRVAGDLGAFLEG